MKPHGAAENKTAGRAIEGFRVRLMERGETDQEGRIGQHNPLPPRQTGVYPIKP